MRRSGRRAPGNGGTPEYSPAAAAVANPCYSEVSRCRRERLPSSSWPRRRPPAAAARGPHRPGRPHPSPGSPVSGFVFYDENANGIAEPAETVRLPSVGVTVGGWPRPRRPGAVLALERAERLPARPGAAGHPPRVLRGGLGAERERPPDGRRRGAGGPGPRRPGEGERLPRVRDSITWGRLIGRLGLRRHPGGRSPLLLGKATVIADGAPATKSNRASRGSARPSNPPPRLRPHPLRDERLERRGVPR